MNPNQISQDLRKVIAKIDFCADKKKALSKIMENIEKLEEQLYIPNPMPLHPFHRVITMGKIMMEFQNIQNIMRATTNNENSELT